MTATRAASPALVCWLLTTAVAAGGWQWLLSPLLDARSDARARLAQVSAAVATATEAVRQRPALAAEIAETARVLATEVPSDAATAISLGAAVVTRAATEAGAVVTRLSPRAPVEVPTMVTVPVEVAIEGTFAAIVGSLSAIEASSAPWFLSRVRVTPIPGETTDARQVVVSAMAIARTGGAK